MMARPPGCFQASRAIARSIFRHASPAWTGVTSGKQAAGITARRGDIRLLAAAGMASARATFGAASIAARRLPAARRRRALGGREVPAAPGLLAASAAGADRAERHKIDQPNEPTRLASTAGGDHHIFRGKSADARIYMLRRPK